MMADRLDVKNSRKDRSNSREGKTKRNATKDNIPQQRNSSSREGSRSSSCTVSRESTPKPFPKHIYTRENLMKFRLSPLCKRRPDYLDELLDNDLSDVVLDDAIGLDKISTLKYDSDVWYKHIRYVHDHDSRGSSPLTLSAQPDRKRYADSESDGVYKRRGSEMVKKDEEDDSGGIVLGPQRKSFGTGCHVTTQLSRRTDSPKEHDRDAGMRRGRIGSGRIQVDRDRERVNDTRDFRDLRDRDSRDIEPRGERRYERHDSHGYDNDRYSRNRGCDRDDWRGHNDRDRNYHKDRHYDNRRYHQPSSEPEWFTSGPTSQSDTIELVGFDGPAIENKHCETRPNDSLMTNENHAEGKDTCVSVADRNGSLETNESSSPEHSQHSEEEDNSVLIERETPVKKRETPPTKTGEFDINEIFSSNIPGLCDIIGIEQEVMVPKEVGGSRFSQWFQPGSRGSTSHENSRRSSINEEFSYLNDLLNGSKSPVIPSPPLTGNAQHVYPSPVDQGKQHIMEFLGARGILPTPHQMEVFHAAQASHHHHNVAVTMAGMTPGHAPTGAVPVNEVEASLKALLLQCNSKPISDNPMKNIPHLVPHGGKVLTAEELEASLTESPNTKQQQGMVVEKSGPEPVPVVGRVIRSIRAIQNTDSSSQVSSDTTKNSETVQNYDQVNVFNDSDMLVKNNSLLSQNIVPPPHQELGRGSFIGSAQVFRRDNDKLIEEHFQKVKHSSNLVGQSPDSNLLNNLSNIGELVLMNEPPSIQQTVNSSENASIYHQNQLSMYSSRLSDPVLQGGKVKTVAELEADLAQHHNKTSVAATAAGGGQIPPRSGQISANVSADISTSKQQDMAAFNKLLGLVKVSGGGQQAPMNPDQKRISDALAAQNSQQQNMNLSAQKEALTRRDMIQKLMQQQQQQQQLKAVAVANAKMQQQQQAAAAQVKQLQQQQMLKQFMGKSPQQQQPHSAAGAAVAVAAIASLVSNKPRVSPVPPPLNLQPTQANPSPRCPSPMLQPPLSPRAPSPIMFGSQPPMHLTAPSPIHASPTVPNPNTLQVTPQAGAGGNQALARVPSPQELIVHTQAIMQNALIKKQLEDQKERFLKRQQERGKSPQQQETIIEESSQAPVPTVPLTPMAVPTSSAMTSTPATTKSAMNPAFTPTSVIRKMASVKGEGKDKPEDAGQIDKKAPILKISENDIAEKSDSRRSSLKSDAGNISIPVPTVNPNQAKHEDIAAKQHHQNIASAEIQALQKNVDKLVDAVAQQQQKAQHVSLSNAIDPGNKAPRPLVGQGVMHIPGQPIQTGCIIGPGMPPVSIPHGSIPMMGMQPPLNAMPPVNGPPPQQQQQQQQSGRPIVKGSPLSPPTPMLKTPVAQPPPAPPKGDGSTQRPIIGNAQNTSPLDAVRLAEQQRQIQAHLVGLQQQANAAGNANMSRNPGYNGSGIPITGRGGPQGPLTGSMPGGVSPQQALLMQRMMMPPNTPTGIQQQIQLAALQAQLVHQQQRPHLDPRAQQGPVRNLYNHSVGSATTPQSRGIYNNAGGISSAAAISRALTSQAHTVQSMASQGRQDPIVSTHSGPMNPILGSGNLAKFFGNDMIKQQMGSLPPLPNQGNQRVLTLEEIERKQQTVIN